MKPNAYKEAGVDIEAGNTLIERIKPAVKKTNRAGVMQGLGGFGALFDLKQSGYQDPILVSATDGVGTKLKIAIETDHYETVGIDLVAMCVNDLVVQGAEPLFFLDYYATGKLDVDQAQSVITGIAKGCEMAGCALIGGETAEMPGMYASGDFDLAGFTVGAVERDCLITGEDILAGDIVLGLESSGLHSNGFSLVRRVTESTQGFAYGQPAPFDGARTLGQIYLEPTKIYVRSLLNALKIKDESGKTAIHGMAHITGGGLLENIPRVIPDGLGANIDVSSWNLPPVFGWLAEIGQISAEDMALTFNCGIGMCVICSQQKEAEITKILQEAGETVHKIGVIEPMDQKIRLKNLHHWA